MSIADQSSFSASAMGGEQAKLSPVAGISQIDPERVQKAWEKAVEQLLAHRTSDGHWTGQLSTSALSTATAVSAIACVVRARFGAGQKVSAPSKSNAFTDHEVSTADLLALMKNGCRWLKDAQNTDGGFGDTDLSHSNIATTLLVLAAWQLAGEAFSLSAAWSKSDLAELTPDRPQFAAAWGYVERCGGWKGLQRRYGRDKTFAVPILSNCALAGLVAWDKVPALPFEAACLPQSWYRHAQLPVVSYAIPALVAIGQARFHFRPPLIPGVHAIRKAAVEPSLRVLMRMQPASGGYLEAVPLTSFVLMSLASIGRGEHPVAVRGLNFLRESVLSDGSWPIDTNLAAWGTSLSIAALTKHLPVDRADQSARVSGVQGESADARLSESSISQWVSPSCIRWLLSCQHRCQHPFTGAAPGGWGWTNLSGAVPDADDTPAAMIALEAWLRNNPAASETMKKQIVEAVAMGAKWLLQLQNRDGGWPTFCRGWGKLPFDRSGTDLTAHAMRALGIWRDRISELPPESRIKLAILDRALAKGWKYLRSQQRPDGSWLPLWFGNQDRPEEDNPAYGTGRVLLAYAHLGQLDDHSAVRAIQYLVESQNSDGGWGGGKSVVYPRKELLDMPPAARNQRIKAERTEIVAPTQRDLVRSTVEETAIVLEALLACGGEKTAPATIMRSVEWTIQAVEQGWTSVSWPIGFYFAKLWYHEQLYPIIYSVAALGSVRQKMHDLNQTVDVRF